MNKERTLGRGRPPFGYDSNGTPNEKDLEALEEVSLLLSNEMVSLREGAEILEHMCGKQISHVGLRDRLARGIRLDGKYTEEEEEG